MEAWSLSRAPKPTGADVRGKMDSGGGVLTYSLPVYRIYSYSNSLNIEMKDLQVIEANWICKFRCW